MNVGPFELLVLAVVGLIVLGPDKLPGLARDAARMLRTLRELSTGARLQLRDQLGPEFSDVDLRSLNPKTALTNFLLGDENGETSSMPSMPNMSGSPRSAIENFLNGVDKPPASPGGEVVAQPGAGAQSDGGPVQLNKATPLGRNEQAPYDLDAT
jgi:sec-independent protein translocase protein TatB